MPAVNANSLKPGNIIEHQSQLYKVVSVYHVKPGKGGAFIQASLKNIKTGNKLDERFRSEENVERVRHESVPAILLFFTNNEIEVTRSDNFEQVTVDKSCVLGKEAFLEEGMEIELNMVEGAVVDIQLPDTVVLEVLETEPKMKNQTVTAASKPAKLSNGITVIVPQFVDIGDKIIVKTEDSTYVERA